MPYYVERYLHCGHCALRAPTVFSVRMKSTSVQKTRLRLTPNTAWRFYTRSSIARGYAFHPCAIDDPRGRFLVRATAQPYNNAGPQYESPRMTLSRSVFAPRIGDQVHSFNAANCACFIVIGGVPADPDRADYLPRAIPDQHAAGQRHHAAAGHRIQRGEKYRHLLGAPR